jgi:hypothetical protein
VVSELHSVNLTPDKADPPKPCWKEPR